MVDVTSRGSWHGQPTRCSSVRPTARRGGAACPLLPSRVAEPGSRALWELVEQVGPVAAERAIRTGDVTSRLRSATAARSGSVDPAADLEAALHCGLRLVVPESAEWPHFAFSALHAVAARPSRHSPERDDGQLVPPIALWVRGNGDLASVGTRSVTIVGARAATAYGESLANTIAYELAGHSVTIVSGGAYGIDAAAHRGALAAGGETVLVSAAGLDRAYPAQNASLYERVAESGLLISESPPGATPQRHRFLARNRLIAAFGMATVVVEAARRSGAANTARHARGLGRVVMAVPGPVTSAMSAGCHELLRGDPPATLVTSAADILAMVAPSASPSGMGGSSGDEATTLDGLPESVRRVLDGFPARRAVSVDELSRSTGIVVRELVQALPLLQIAGMVQENAGYFRLTRGGVANHG